LLVKYSCPRDQDLPRFFIASDYRFSLWILLDLFSASCSEARSRSMPAPRVHVPKKLLSRVRAPASVAAWTAPRIFLFACACPPAFIIFHCRSLVLKICFGSFVFPPAADSVGTGLGPRALVSQCWIFWHVLVDSSIPVREQRHGQPFGFCCHQGFGPRIQALNHFSLASIWVHGHNSSSFRE
jgi:hypothetical protein